MDVLKNLNAEVWGGSESPRDHHMQFSSLLLNLKMGRSRFNELIAAPLLSGQSRASPGRQVGWPEGQLRTGESSCRHLASRGRGSRGPGSPPLPAATSFQLHCRLFRRAEARCLIQPVEKTMVGPELGAGSSLSQESRAAGFRDSRWPGPKHTVHQPCPPNKARFDSPQSREGCTPAPQEPLGGRSATVKMVCGVTTALNQH